ncbi:hypothetical protein B0T21DRAFT_368188, partial [Apiosordaria backusii]
MLCISAHLICQVTQKATPKYHHHPQKREEAQRQREKIKREGPRSNERSGGRTGGL